MRFALHRRTNEGGLINAQIAALLVAEFVQKKRRFVQETAVDGVVLREMLVPAAVVRRERG
jgi:hypothetical protein